LGRPLRRLSLEQWQRRGRNGETYVSAGPGHAAVGHTELTDGELFYIVQNGIRLTGMPSWGSGTSRDKQDSWKLVRFIRYLPKLTPEEEKEMEAANPKSPDELKEEEEERNFLNGDELNESKQHEHH
jgi:hypothetical protein